MKFNIEFDIEFDVEFDFEFDIDFDVEFDFGFNFAVGTEPPYTRYIVRFRRALIVFKGDGNFLSTIITGSVFVCRVFWNSFRYLIIGSVGCWRTSTGCPINS